ncbi:MAG: N-acetylglucosamine-6-phosphate deacetylase [Verrucomicrobiales bacterium]
MADALHAACEQVRANGATHILATIITDAVDTMRARLRRIVGLREADALVREVIVGVHVEGPFLNETPGYIGAHPAEHARAAEVETMKRLLEAGGGLVKLVTLAPERDPGFATTRFLAGEGLVVSAGHCDPTLEQLRAAIDAGLTMFTHLGNGCPMQLHRHDNIIQRALGLSEKLWLCFIADGAHVPLFALANYFKVAGLDRCIAVTDAISAAGLGPGRYTLGGWELDIGDDLIAWGPNRAHLVGSTATMNRVRQNLAIMGLSAADVDLLTISNPRRALQLEDTAPLIPVT